VIYLVALLAVLVVALIAMRMVSRQIRRNTEHANSLNFDFDLGDLQKLVDKGQMTQEEFRRARAVILSHTHASLEPAKGFPVLGPVDQGKSDQK